VVHFVRKKSGTIFDLNALLSLSVCRLLAKCRGHFSKILSGILLVVYSKLISPQLGIFLFFFDLSFENGGVYKRH